VEPVTPQPPAPGQPTAGGKAQPAAAGTPAAAPGSLALFAVLLAQLEQLTAGSGATPAPGATAPAATAAATTVPATPETAHDAHDTHQTGVDGAATQAVAAIPVAVPVPVTPATPAKAGKAPVGAQADCVKGTQPDVAPATAAATVTGPAPAATSTGLATVPATPATATTPDPVAAPVVAPAAPAVPAQAVPAAAPAAPATEAAAGQDPAGAIVLPQELAVAAAPTVGLRLPVNKAAGPTAKPVETTAPVTAPAPSHAGGKDDARRAIRPVEAVQAADPRADAPGAPPQNAVHVAQPRETHADPVATPLPPAPLDRERFDRLVDGLAARLKLSHAGDGARVRMQLDPKELGEVVVRLEIRDGIAQASLITDNRDAGRVLQSALADLRSGLADRGVQLDRVDVRVADDGKGRQQDPRHPHGHRHAPRGSLFTLGRIDPAAASSEPALAAGSVSILA
jgi:flagellar hook-length control protein FliK